MIKPDILSLSSHSMSLLSRLLLLRPGIDESSWLMMLELKAEVRGMARSEFDNVVALASSNHVVVRGLEAFLGLMLDGEDDTRAEWARTALAVERARITLALSFLSEVCAAFEGEQYGVAVIKSLDHWPDLGSDLDLYTDAHAGDVSKLMRNTFDAQIASRSWGDRLAGKWNFLIPGLPEAVEIHMGRLGQTGEQVGMASRLAKRTRRVTIDDREFRVPSVSDRLMISTLQRMYRHFYFRLCDIVDTSGLIDMGAIDYGDLCSAASEAGIWEGVATYLVVVSDYVRKYNGRCLDLPQFVISAARFGGDQIFYAKEFLRVPIVPQAAKLYGSQLAGLLRKRELQGGARLSLLPWLATAAAVGQKITGSDKGIW